MVLSLTDLKKDLSRTKTLANTRKKEIERLRKKAAEAELEAEKQKGLLKLEVERNELKMKQAENKVDCMKTLYDLRIQGWIDKSNKDEIELHRLRKLVSGTDSLHQKIRAQTQDMKNMKAKARMR